jgi:cysteinyl-tRNA synthetase
MTKYKTSTGTVTVNNWGYQLQGPNGRPLDDDDLISATHDLLVIDATHDGHDATRFTEDELSRIKDGMGGRSVVVSYLSIGEADDYRDFWDKDWTTNGRASGQLTDDAPDWLGPTNPDWPESRKVRYWDTDWQNVIYNKSGTGELDGIVKAGFDAAYLDIIDAYYFWGAEVSDKDRAPGDPKNEHQAAQSMVDFVVDMTEHARETNPDFFVIPQNGEWILEDLGNDKARKEAYLNAIGGIGVEDLYFRGGKDENNRLHPDKQTINVLKHDFLDNGIPVYVTDYLNDKHKIAQFYKLATADGFTPYASPHRDLDTLTGTFDGDPAYIRPTAGADKLRGSLLNDTIDALAGNDRVDGRDGDDKLDGGLGKDILTGGAGKDDFIFDTKLGTGNVDTVKDFEPGNDRIVLDHSIFTKLDKGALADGAFEMGTSASNADVRILYDSETGALSYDVDGSGDGKAVQFAHVSAGLNVAASDLWIM